MCYSPKKHCSPITHSLLCVRKSPKSLNKVLEVVTEVYSKAEGLSKSKPRFEILPERGYGSRSAPGRSKRTFWQGCCDCCEWCWSDRPKPGVALAPGHSFQLQPWKVWLWLWLSCQTATAAGSSRLSTSMETTGTQSAAFLLVCSPITQHC